MNRILKNSAIILALFVLGSCKKEKDAVLPELSFKTGSGYLSKNASVSQGSVFTVGVVADKTKRELRKFEVNYSYDGDEFEQHLSYLLSSSEKSHFERDVEITTRNEQGSEVWQFEITDIDGNTALEKISLSVN